MLKTTLLECCYLITELEILRRADIISTEVYAKRRAGPNYPFLVIEVALNTCKTLYFRFDGRRERRPTRLASSKSEREESNHTVIYRCTIERAHDPLISNTPSGTYIRIEGAPHSKRHAEEQTDFQQCSDARRITAITTFHQ